MNAECLTEIDDAFDGLDEQREVGASLLIVVDLAEASRLVGLLDARQLDEPNGRYHRAYVEEEAWKETDDR